MKTFELLEINESLKEIFNCQPITAFRRNKNLKKLIGSNNMEENKVEKRQIRYSTMSNVPAAALYI